MLYNISMEDNSSHLDKGTAKESIAPDIVPESVKGMHNENDDGLNEDNGEKSGASRRNKAGAMAGHAAEALAAGAGPVGKVAGLAAAKAAEKLPIKVSVGGKDDSKQGSKRAKIVKYAVPVVIILMIFAAGAFLNSMSPILLYQIQHGLLDTSGATVFDLIGQDEMALLSGVAMKDGKVAKNYADDLAKVGIEVGQLTAAGDFVQTNTYIAGLGEDKEVAALNDNYQAEQKSGELVVRFEGDIINASDFATAVDSNPRLAAAYAEGANFMSYVTYSRSGREILEGMVKNFGYNFAGWEEKASEEENHEQFLEMLASALEVDSDLLASGYNREDQEGSFTAEFSGDAESVVDYVAKKTTSLIGEEDATNRGIELLNSIAAANEPYRAAAAFAAAMEIIERAEIYGEPVVNEFTRVLAEVNTVTIEDVSTHEEVQTTGSILDSANFSATVSGGGFSQEEAANFSLDSSLKATDFDSSDLISETRMSTEGRERSHSVLGIDLGFKANKEVLANTTDTVSMAIFDDTSETYSSVIGANYTSSGGPAVVNRLGTGILGALPSDTETVQAYNREAKDLIDKRIAVERATKSPFDISSRYTFLGSIAHNLASTILNNYSKIGQGIPAVSTISTVADLTDQSVKDLFGGAIAEGTDNSFLSVSGEYCKTPESFGINGNLWCYDKDVLDVSHLEGKTRDEDFDIDSDSYEDYVKYFAERESRTGNRDVGVCEKANPMGIIDSFLDLFGLYEVCDGVDPDIATGAAYALSSSNPKRDQMAEAGAYTFFQVAKQFVTGEETTASKIKREYYAEHPKDNSKIGKLSRRSGLSRAEVHVALNYYDYLVQIAQYDPASRYVFGGVLELLPENTPLVAHSRTTSENLYGYWMGKIEYDDVRNRNFAA